jgi:hypothetical protein
MLSGMSSNFIPDGRIFVLVALAAASAINAFALLAMP